MSSPTHTSETILCAVLFGNTEDDEKAQTAARLTQGCPYIAHYATAGNTVIGVFALPATKRWWIEYPQEHPEALGLTRAVVLITDQVTASSPWSRGEVKPVANISPCHSDCRKCPHYGTRCQGCPATEFYLG